jgi:hypothetical protein
MGGGVDGKTPATSCRESADIIEYERNFERTGPFGANLAAPRWVLRFTYGVFEPGAFIEDTGPAWRVHFFQANEVFKY